MTESEATSQADRLELIIMSLESAIHAVIEKDFQLVKSHR